MGRVMESNMQGGKGGGGGGGIGQAHGPQCSFSVF